MDDYYRSYVVKSRLIIGLIDRSIQNDIGSCVRGEAKYNAQIHIFADVMTCTGPQVRAHPIL